MTLLICSSTSQSAADKGTQGQMTTHHFPLWRKGARAGKGWVSPLQPDSLLETQWGALWEYGLMWSWYMIYASTLLHWRLYVREDGRQNKWPYLSSRFSQHISEVNALYLYPEVRESWERWISGGYKGRQKAGERAWE